MTEMSHFAKSRRIAHFGQDVWSIFSPMALYCKAVNLGQGFPNFEASPFVKDAAKMAVDSNFNQYSPPKGMPQLRKVLAEEYGPLLNRQLNGETDIIVTAGANEGMYAAFLAFLNDGDEVLCFEPFFDQYAPNIQMCGAKMKFCPLLPKSGANVHSNNGNTSAADWTFDREYLESQISAQTKMIVVNTPHNPVGKVFSRAELEQIAEIAIKHNLIVISDEVYERLIYPGAEHVRIATLPGMWDRTITVGSAGKSFCVTGWRVGWLLGPQHLINPALIAHSRIVFCTNAPLQVAVAEALKQSQTNGYFEKQCQEYLERREYILKIFDELGLPAVVPDGSYFTLVDISSLQIPQDQLKESEEIEKIFCLDGVVPQRSRDWQVCRWLTTHLKVAAIPPAEFYSQQNQHLASNYARFAFCKDLETLKQAKENLQKLKQYIVKK
ncbi:hypothetical protein MP228_009371 [Amoeboaphelidium protococcarum]|nr:hypothetical protein MP228_009371 [Amoeboaphelidium protococcarum]